MKDTNDMGSGAANLLIPLSSEQAEEQHQGIMLKLLFIQVCSQNRCNVNT
ncbi:hypothetical protein HanLR1_Chr14g0533661 [Helianthus annuus]|nr:hypothetical protein HanLR1_Chr14g0533661 [Helianthus annuus]